MLALSVVAKIVMAVCALIVSVLGIAGVKALRIPPKGFPVLPLGVSRLTKAGWVLAICAIGIFVAGAANEILTFAKEKAASAMAEADRNGLQQKLDEAARRQREAGEALASSFLETSKLSRLNQYLVRSLDGAMQRVGSIRVQASEIDDIDLELQFESGQAYKPKRGDIFDWTFVCRNGPLPPAAKVDSAMCRPIGYGRLVANNFSIPLMAGSGRMTFFGTKTTGGTLSYRSSAEESACRDTARSLKDSQCELDISVLSEARWRFEDMESLRKPENAMLPALDACRRYEALYGETCADAVRRLTK